MLKIHSKRTFLAFSIFFVQFYVQLWILEKGKTVGYHFLNNTDESERAKEDL